MPHIGVGLWNPQPRKKKESLMKRVAYFVYGLVCYLMFVGVLGYAIGFLADAFVPRTVSSGIDAPLGSALLINVSLLGVFGLQHSIMARPAFKRIWTRMVPEPIERSTYVLATNLTLILLFWQWRSVGGYLWNVQDALGRTMLQGLYGAGILLVFVSTVLLNHFELFGMRQVWLYLRGKPYTHLPFKLPSFYRHVRHPLYVGWITVFWATPVMSYGHLLFAFVATAYILVAVRLEERDLVGLHGSLYDEYRRQVPMFIPRMQGVAMSQIVEQSEAQAVPVRA